MNEGVNSKNRLFPSVLAKIEAGKKLSKSEMGYQIGHVSPYHFAALYYDKFSRSEVVESFNKVFGTSIT
jgi:hypothetical protein